MCELTDRVLVVQVNLQPVTESSLALLTHLPLFLQLWNRSQGFLCSASDHSISNCISNQQGYHRIATSTSLQTDADSWNILSKQMSFHQGNINEEFEVEERGKFHRSPPACSSCVVPFCLYKDLRFLTADVTPALKQEGPADSCNNRSFCHCHVLSFSQPLPYAKRELRWEYFYNRTWSY